MMFAEPSRAASWLTIALAGALCLTACGDTSPSQSEPTRTAESALGQASPTTGGTYLRKTLADGAEFHATNGMRMGPDGNIYVASVLSRSIGVVDPDSGEILDRIGPERGVESPDDLAFGPDGSLYWTSFLTGEVGRLTPDGVKETVAQLGAGVNAIAFSPDGRLFVTRVFLGDELYELDPDGDAPPRMVASGLMGLNAMDFGPDGELYGPLWFGQSVVRVDVDSGATTEIFDGLEVPAAVKFNSEGILHVVDQLAGQVIAYDLDTDTSEVVAQVESAGADNLAIDEDDDIYLTNSHDGWVRKVLPNGKTRSLTDEGIVAPGGVAVVPYDGGESVFIADALSIKGFDAQTGQQTAEAHAVIGVSPLSAPISAKSDAGRLLTTSWFANVVQVWDPAVHAVVESHQDFAVPLNAVRYDGDLVVAELATNRVVSRPAGTNDTIPMAQVPVPTGLATDGDSLWVADWATGRVLRIAQGGQPLATPEMVAWGLSFPEGMTVDNDGTLLVVETGTDQLTRIDPTTGQKTVVEDGLDVGLQGPAGVPPTYIFNGVDVDQCGNIYVSVDTDNAIEKLTPQGAGAPGCLNGQ
ncbi:MAG: SMP-30/gluconolactonase/LRE family protein [Persicimonas sp.]